MANFDTGWKYISEYFFQEMVTFFFPHIFQEIDWEKGYSFLEKELLTLQRENEVENRRADKLVKVFKLNGEEAWVLIHLEFQGKRQTHFSDRMFEYYYRAYDKYKMPLMSVAILTDKNKKWRPNTFEKNLWGCYVKLGYLSIKLVDYNISELDKSTSPMAKVIKAHLCALKTQKNATLCFKNKLALVKELYPMGYNIEDIRAIYHFIDYIMMLPKELEKSLKTEIEKHEKEMNMYPLTSFEKIGMENGFKKGIQEGMQQGLKQGIQHGVHTGECKILCLLLEKKFGPLSPQNLDIINSANSQILEQMVVAAINANSIYEVFTKAGIANYSLTKI